MVQLVQLELDFLLTWHMAHSNPPCSSEVMHCAPTTAASSDIDLLTSVVNEEKHMEGVEPKKNNAGMQKKRAGEYIVQPRGGE